MKIVFSHALRVAFVPAVRVPQALALLLELTEILLIQIPAANLRQVSCDSLPLYVIFRLLAMVSASASVRMCWKWRFVPV